MNFTTNFPSQVTTEFGFTPLPVFLTQNAIANWRRLTASMFDPGVNSVT